MRGRRREPRLVTALEHALAGACDDLATHDTPPSIFPPIGAPSQTPSTCVCARVRVLPGFSGPPGGSTGSMPPASRVHIEVVS